MRPSSFPDDRLDQVGEIVVLERGRMAERGTRVQLASSGRVYHRLWQAGREVRA